MEYVAIGKRRPCRPRAIVETTADGENRLRWEAWNNRREGRRLEAAWWGTYTGRGLGLSSLSVSQGIHTIVPKKGLPDLANRVGVV